MSANILKITQSAREIFDSFDSDHDGVINKSELKPLLSKISKQLGVPEPSDKDIEQGFKQLDLNKNDLLEFNEFFHFYKQIYEMLTHN